MADEVAGIKGPWSHRALIWGFGVALSALCFWLIGQLGQDFGQGSPPDYSSLEQSMLDSKLVAERDRLEDRIAETKRIIERDTGRQNVLRQSTEEAQRTMNQLLDLQRLSLEKGTALSPSEQKSLGESQQIFLENQRRFQEVNQRITKSEDERDELESRLRELDK